MPPGWGTDGWGTSPWGGIQQMLVDDLCDLVLFEEADLDNILTAPGVLGIAADTAQQLPAGGGTLCLYSGDSTDPLFPQGVAYVEIVPVGGIGTTYTLEFDLTLEDVPVDFSNLTTHHLAFGVTDTTGPCAALFISQVGLGYAGAFHYNPTADPSGVLVLDSSFTQIPGTAPLIQPGVPTTIRLAVSSPTNSVYVFVTPTADVDVIGHQLAAILPTIDVSELTVSPSQDRTIFSVDGTPAQPSRVCMERWCLSSQFVTPNIRPIANAGQDQAIRQCNIAIFDGSASFDPEGGNLLYSWRLIDGPAASEFVDQLFDGGTFPGVPPTGFTDKFHSVDLESIHATDPIVAGDVILIDAVARTITGTGVDGNGFHVVVTTGDIVDNLAATPFKILRSRALSGADTVSPTFFADVPGFYKLDLVVFDGNLTSKASVVILNVLESVIPRGCVPDASFIFDYLSDFWKLVEDADKLPVFWSAMSQVVATELYTLWQHEYSKSLRDIQRTIARRWLHYDLLLAEPIPDITRLRVLWSGVESSNITNVGPPGIDGTDLVLSSPAFEGLATLTFTNSTDPDGFAAELQARLRALDSRFSTQVLDEKVAGSPTFKRVRIDAPFPFTIDGGTTIPYFTVGDVNGLVSGSAGAVIGVDTYFVETSLEGLGLAEDDLLVLDGVGYRISRLVSGETGVDPDTFNFQRIVLKDSIPVGGVPTDWTIASVVRSELVDFYNGLVSFGDPLYFEVSDSTTVDDATLVKVTALGVNESLPGRCAFDHTPLGTLLEEEATLFFAKAIRRTYLPISDLVVDLPTLQGELVITDDEAVLRRNIDYFLEEFRGGSAIHFESGLNPGDVWEGADPPDRLWGEYTFIDNRPAIEANFGIPADFTLDKLEVLPTEVDYLAAVQGLWYAYLNGPTLRNIRTGVQIFLGLPFAEAAGTIEEIREDFSPTTGRILIRDTVDTQIVRSYRYKTILNLEINPVTGERYVEGDTVKQFAPLVEGAEIIDYVKDPTWFKSLLNQGIFEEIQKYFTFNVRIQSEAFDIGALSLVQDFVLRIKPTYTHPVYVISLVIDRDGSDTTVDVTDDINFNVTLRLYDSPCGHFGATMFDDPRAGGGGYWNQFDSDDDPLNPPPTPPTPDTPILWAFDKEYLCPNDVIVVQCDIALTGGGPHTVSFDSCFSYDSNVTFLTRFADTPPTLPITAAGVAITPVGSNTYPAAPSPPAPPPVIPVFGTGNITQARILIFGDPGSDPTDYEFVVKINGGIEEIVAFDASFPATEVTTNFSPGAAVTHGDVITFEVRVASGGDRNPNWSEVRGRVEIEDGPFSFDMLLPDGLYTGERLLT